MTDNLEEAIEVTRALPSQWRDDLARPMMLCAGHGADDPVCELSPDEEAALRVGIDQMERGVLATDGQVRSTWATHER